MMIGYIRLVCSVIVIISLMRIKNITGVEWEKIYFESYYNLIALPNSMLKNEAIISEQSNAPSVISCSRFCGERELSFSMYFNQNENTCYCNNELDNRLTLEDPVPDDSTEIVYGYMVSTVQVSSNTTTLKYDIQPYPENCFRFYHHGYTTNAIYTVKPLGGNIQDTYCDMDNVLDVGADDCLQWLQAGYTDNGVYNISLSNGTTVSAWCDQTGGGWTVFQRRHDGSVDFFRGIIEYLYGFGDPSVEYWLGLEAIYFLTQQRSSLRIYLEAFGEDVPHTAFAIYDDFSLAPVSDKYRLSFGSFTGDCGDSFSDSNGMRFSAWDNDNDANDYGSCAGSSCGGWWYASCSNSNLNGKYHGGYYTSPTNNGMYWKTCWNFDYSVKACSMGVKRS